MNVFFIKINDFIILKFFNSTRPNFEVSSHCAVSRAHATEREGPPATYVRESVQPQHYCNVKKRQNDVSMAPKFKTVIHVISTAMYLKPKIGRPDFRKYP